LLIPFKCFKAFDLKSCVEKVLKNKLKRKELENKKKLSGVLNQNNKHDVELFYLIF
jgi:hypothetical protein